MRQAHYTHAACGGTILGEVSVDLDYYSCSRCGAYTYAMDEDGVAMTAADVPDGCDPARNAQAWDAGEWRSPEAQWDDVPPGHVRCESGAWSGEGEHHTVLRDAAVLMWYVPDHLRDTARTLLPWDAAGAPIRYSLGMAECIEVCPACAEQMCEHDPDWTTDRGWRGR